MAFEHMAKGGAFKGAAEGQGYDHGNAMKMAHAANRKLAVAKALGAPKAAPAAPPPAAGNYKAQVAHVAHAQGVPSTVQHVHNAIDSLTQKGALTPFQGNALKQHNGPLEGPAGQRTVGMIANELVQNPKVRT